MISYEKLNKDVVKFFRYVTSMKDVLRLFEINNSFSISLNFMKKYKQAFNVGFSTFSMIKKMKIILKIALPNGV